MPETGNISGIAMTGLQEKKSISSSYDGSFLVSFYACA